MNEHQKSLRIKAFEERCRKENLPMTTQRRVILEEMLASKDHPSADEVYERVIRRLSATSRTTVYRTLDTLVAMGLITKTCHPGRSVRYDSRTEVHHHLVCLRCDTILDLNDPDLDSIRLPDTSALGFRAEDHRVQIRGVCKDCRDKEEKR